MKKRDGSSTIASRVGDLSGERVSVFIFVRYSQVTQTDKLSSEISGSVDMCTHRLFTTRILKCVLVAAAAAWLGGPRQQSPKGRKMDNLDKKIFCGKSFQLLTNMEGNLIIVQF
jgi:hypothetical protein